MCGNERVQVGRRGQRTRGGFRDMRIQIGSSTGFYMRIHKGDVESLQKISQSGAKMRYVFDITFLKKGI